MIAVALAHPTDLVIALLGVLPLFAALWLALLAACSADVSEPGLPTPPLFFDVVVPAHDEEAGIAATLRSLREMDWPLDLFRVVVVADNCSDRTAAIAASEGAQVLRRDDPARIGKGWALRLAFSRSVYEGRADAVVVVDADTLVSANLLRSFAARLAQGAIAVQADYRVRNALSSPRRSLAAVAFGAFHGLRSRARERLGLSCGLRGNGMCFSREALERVPYDAVSLVEDVEYGLRLAEEGVRVWSAQEAAVLGEMPQTAAGSAAQQQRWESGRRSLRKRAVADIGRALRRRDAVLFEAAADLLLPRLSMLAAATVAGLSTAVSLALTGAGGASVLVWGTAALLLCVYVARGWSLSGTGAAGLRALAVAPAFVAWKVGMLVRSRAPERWTRTPRG
ncbi:MAG: glycosyltransferase family 2 protein [Myxococcales bacterium]